VRPHEKVRVAVVGAGSRGEGYARLVAGLPDAVVTAIAEPRTDRRDTLADELGVDLRLDDWRPLLDGIPVADAVIISVQDADHREPTEAFLDAGFHVLVEKPLAPRWEDVAAMVTAATARPAQVFGVCHVLQYTPYTRALMDLLGADAIGDVVSIHHLEPVGWWHHAHSFVRGNWRREDISSFMLLAKSCHDIDWLCHVMGADVARVSSFGSLSFFTRAHQPAQAADRCVDCALQDSCAYSATRIYLDRARAGATDWPLDVLDARPTVETIEHALASGPYGRCVWACDNDVVDHQVVTMEFDGGATAAFTMTAFTDHANRRTEIFGTQGCIKGDGRWLEVLDFRTGQTTRHDTAPTGSADAAGGHAGGDAGLVSAFVAAIRDDDPGSLTSGARQTWRSHAATFAAEHARRSGTVVDVASFAGERRAR
jgi:predicted dehydrogenase